MGRQPSEQTIDPRVQRTQQRLKDALVELMKVEPVENISVQKVTDGAGVTRGTFYLHYHDKQDFVLKTIDAIVDDFFDHVVFFRETADMQRCPYLSLMEAFIFVEREHETFEVLVKSQSDLFFTEKIYQRVGQYLHDYARASQAQVSGEIPVDLEITYVTAAHLGFMMSWVEAGLIYSPHYMAKTLHQLAGQATANGHALNGFFVLDKS